MFICCSLSLFIWAGLLFLFGVKRACKNSLAFFSESDDGLDIAEHFGEENYFCACKNKGGLKG